jgi:hypothetical protein
MPVINRLMVYLQPAIIAILIQVAILLALYLLTD